MSLFAYDDGRESLIDPNVGKRPYGVLPVRSPVTIRERHAVSALAISQGSIAYTQVIDVSQVILDTPYVMAGTGVIACSSAVASGYTPGHYGDVLTQYDLVPGAPGEDSRAVHIQRPSSRSALLVAALNKLHDAISMYDLMPETAMSSVEEAKQLLERVRVELGNWSQTTVASNVRQASAMPLAPLLPDASFVARDRTARLAVIQRAFGCSISQLAKILQVNRSMLYRWLDPNDPVKLRKKAADRVKQIGQIAEAWLAHSKRTLATYAEKPVHRGATVFDLLCATDLDTLAMESAFKLLAQDVGPDSSLEAMRARGHRIRRSVLPFDD